MSNDALARALVAPLLKLLRPFLVEAAAGAVAKSMRQSGTVRMEPGFVVRHDPTTGRATVSLDADDQDTTSVRAVGVYPLAPGDRIMVLMIPPMGGYIIGHGLGSPVITIASTDGSGKVVSEGWEPVALVAGPNLHQKVQVTYAGSLDITRESVAPGHARIRPQISLDGAKTWSVGQEFSALFPAGYDDIAMSWTGFAAGQPTGPIYARLMATLAAGPGTISQAGALMTVTPLYAY